MKTTTVYKLTDPDATTYAGLKWEVGVWMETSGEGDLCGQGWLHAYEHPLLAILHNPMHANIQKPLLWEAQAAGEIKRDRQVKLGATKMRITKRLKNPEITRVQCVCYGILAAKQVCEDPEWNRWADDWLSGKSRTIKRAWESEVRARALWSAREASWAGREASRSAWSLARAMQVEVEMVSPELSPWAKPWARSWVSSAKEAAARSAEWASRKKSLNLIKIAGQTRGYR